MADFLDQALGVVAAVAPTIAAALGGPLAGQAVQAIEGAFGLTPTGDEAAASQAVVAATPEQLLALKKADQDFQAKIKALDVDLERVAAGDRDSARKREVALKDWTPRFLAALVVGGYVLVQWFVLTHIVDQSMREIVLRSLGTLDAALGLVLSYFFGSSRGSDDKTAIIADLKRGK